MRNLLLAFALAVSAAPAARADDTDAAIAEYETTWNQFGTWCDVQFWWWFYDPYYETYQHRVSLILWPITPYGDLDYDNSVFVTYPWRYNPEPGYAQSWYEEPTDENDDPVVASVPAGFGDTWAVTMLVEWKYNAGPDRSQVIYSTTSYYTLYIGSP